MTALQVGSWQSTFSANDPFVQSFTLTQAAASGRALVVFASGVNAAATDTMSVPTFNGVAPTFSSRRGNTEEASGTGSFIAVCVWMNANLPSTAGSYNVSFAGANYGKALSICEFSGISSTAVIKSADIANARNTNLTVTLASVIANSLNFTLHSNNPGYSADWVNANSDTVVYAGSGNVYCKPYLLSRHGSTGTLNFAPTTTGSGEPDSWTNWRHGAAVSLQPRTPGVINSGNPVRAGQTAVTVTASGFTGAATMTLVAGALTQAQTFTSLGGGSFTINTMTQGSLPFGAMVLRVVEGVESEDIALTLIPALDSAYTNIAGHNITADSIFYNYAPYASITQVEYTEADLVYEITRDHVLTQNTTIYADGTFNVQRDVPSFQVRLHDGTAWSSFATISLNPSDVVTVPTFPAVCRSTSHQTLWHKFSNAHPFKYLRYIYSRPSFDVPLQAVGGLVAAMIKDPELHTRAAAILPSAEFYETLRNGATVKLFDIVKLRDSKQQVNVTFNLAANQDDTTRYEYKFKFENEFWTKEDPIIADRSPRSYTLDVGEFATGPETDLGQETINFVAGGPPVKFGFNIIDNEYVMQPFYGEAPIRDYDNWVKFKPAEWVGVVIVTRWSRYHGGWHAVYINGIKLYETTGGSMPSSADVFFKLGLNAYTLAWSRRSISFKDVKIVLNPATLLP